MNNLFLFRTESGDRRVPWLTNRTYYVGSYIFFSFADSKAHEISVDLKRRMNLFTREDESFFFQSVTFFSRCDSFASR